MGQPIVEKRWEYKGFTCVVLFMPMGHRCGYVAIPKGHKFHGVGYDDLNVSCHGGLTYSRDYLQGCADLIGYWNIGFDCAHWNDDRDYETAEKLFDNEDEDMESLRHLKAIDLKYGTNGKIRTLDYCINECESIVEQLLSESVEL